MDEPIGKMEAHNKVPRGFLVLLFGLIAFGVYYIAAYTPEISGWSQYKVLSREMEADKAKAAAGAAKMTENPYERDEKAVAEGQGIYAGKCAECHGEDLKGSGRPFPDRPPEVRRARSRDVRVDRQGPPGRDARVRDGTGTGPDLEGAGVRRLGPGVREETVTAPPPSPPPGYTRSMWKNRRRIVALLGGAATLLLPFLRIRGRSAARFDLPTLSLHLFGAVVPIDEFYLVLLGALFLVALTLWVTVVFGRLWCGWLCPQTVIGEIGEWIASALPNRFRVRGKKAALLPFSGLVSLSLLWYFLPPVEATRNLFRSPILLGFFLVLWGVTYIMVAVIGPRFCKTVCPYAMLQNVLADGETLAVAFDPERAECLRCDRCTRVCPVGIDIRKGGQRECIACASCIDACREVTSRRNIASFISYRGTVLRGKAYLFAGVCATAALVLLAALWSRPDVRFAVQWEGKAGTARGNVYRYSVRNDSDLPIAVALSVGQPARLSDGAEVEVPSRGRVTGTLTVQGEDGTRERS